jgi:hypothetical protein
MATRAIVPIYQAQTAAIIAEETTVTDWLRLVRAEYLEIPGLHLTRRQVQRLWGLDDTTCDALLQTLVETRFLRCTQADAYVLNDEEQDARW